MVRLFESLLLSTAYLHEINREKIEEAALAKEAEGVKPVSVNRMLEILRAILRRAHNDWEWLETIPVIRMRYVEKSRVRWLSQHEANRLMKELPQHLADMAAFSLATGLRAANVRELKWEDIDMERCHAWINPDKAKAKKAVSVPLNKNAMAILEGRQETHAKYVFTYNGNPVGKCNTRAWRNALRRAGIENFRWHDLRHTWASWHVQNGTSLQELQVLGGWSSLEMVLRYAHLSSDHLKTAADRVPGTFLLKSTWFETTKSV